MRAHDRLVRMREVIGMVGLSKATIYRKVRTREFPAPVSVGGHSVRWRESELLAWIAALSQRAA